MPPPDSIDAPYSFVPLAKWVYTPKWAGLVSHDLPFRDGLSGHLDLTIIAETPVLVGREQQPATTNAPGEVHPYQLPDGRYALPGTSLKGMIRSVVEIASFSRMAMVDDQRLGVRDLTPAARPFYGNFLTKTVDKKRKIYEALSKAGWLSFDTARECWLIQPCDYARVEHSDLTVYRGTPRINLKDYETAQNKYAAWSKPLDIQFDYGSVEPHPHSGDKFLVYRKVSNLGSGSTTGTLVFTGQPSPGKHMEFIFFNNASHSIQIPENVFRGFLDVHDQKTGNATQTAWDDWKGKAQIPVFYLEERDKSGTVASLGLAQMYKLAYRHSIHDAIRHSSEKHLDGGGDDLANLLFGRVGDTPADCLRGRVTFHHAIAEGDDIQPQTQPATILNSPKPTYYPSYIRQPSAQGNRIPEGKGYATLMNDQCEIRGWKRYPARPTEQAQVQILTVEQMDNTAVQVILHPLPAETTFRARMSLHNLKPEELGALCWALTWGGTEELKHSLGMGKSFGFGQLSITIDKSYLRPNQPNGSVPKWEECRDAFIKLMDDTHQLVFNKIWRNSDQIKTLLGMADPNKRPTQGQLRHMRLTTEDDNEFKKAKEQRLVLADYQRTDHPPTWGKLEALRQEALRAQAVQVQKVQKQAALEMLSCSKEAFDTLPDEEKITKIREAFQALNEYERTEQRQNLVSILNRLADAAKIWTDHSNCEQARDLLTQVFDEIGWFDPDKKNKKQREKQAAKRRKIVDEICKKD